MRLPPTCVPGLAALAAALIAGSAAAAPGTPVAAAAVSPVSAPVAAPDPRALELSREIIRIGFPEEMRPVMFGGAVDAMTAQMRGAMLARFNNDPAARAILDRSLNAFLTAGKGVLGRHIPALMDACAAGYARTFPVAELEQILAFVKTPAGAHFIQRSSTIISDPAFAEANQAYLRELQPLIERMRETVTRDLTLYYLEHPPKPSSGS